MKKPKHYPFTTSVKPTLFAEFHVTLDGLTYCRRFPCDAIALTGDEEAVVFVGFVREG